MKSGYTSIIEILYKNELVGFMILNRIKANGYAVLDYLAILPQYRNNKFGTEALKELIKQNKEIRGIFIEIEKVGLGKDKEENINREKRKYFCEKLGFKKLNYDLLLFEVIYTPYIYSNFNDNEEVVVDEILKIYEEISGKKRIQQNCKFINIAEDEDSNDETAKMMKEDGTIS